MTTLCTYLLGLPCSGPPHSVERLDASWNAMPAGYYPDDGTMIGCMDAGIRDVADILSKQLRDFAGQRAYVMLDRLQIKALPDAPAGPAFSYHDLARLPLLSGLKVQAQPS